MTSSSVSVADGLVAFVLLVALQTVVALLGVFVPGARTIITGTPTLIAYHGELLRGPMKRERVSEPDVEQALRQRGHRSLDSVAAVVLETTGDLTIVDKGEAKLEILTHVAD